MAVISDKAMQAKPGGSDAWPIEAGARGEGRLVGRITPAGARSFYYRYTASGGDRVRLLIGPYDCCRRTYIRDRREGEQGRAFDALGARLSELATGAPAARNVVSLRAA